MSPPKTLRLFEVVDILEQFIDVDPARKRAFRERLNHINKHQSVLTKNGDIPGRDNYDYHAFHQLTQAFLFQMLGIRVERCHHIIAPWWHQYHAIAWAKAWLEVLATAPIISVGSDEHFEYSDRPMEVAIFPASQIDIHSNAILAVRRLHLGTTVIKLKPIIKKVAPETYRYFLAEAQSILEHSQERNREQTYDPNVRIPKKQKMQINIRYSM